MSSEFLMITPLYSVRLKTFEWIKLFLHQSPENWAGRNFITTSRVNSLLITYAGVQRWNWNPTEPSNDKFIDAICLGGYAWPALTVTWVSKHLCNLSVYFTIGFAFALFYPLICYTSLVQMKVVCVKSVKVTKIYSWLPINRTLANSNQNRFPLDFHHTFTTFTVILPSITQTFL